MRAQTVGEAVAQNFTRMAGPQILKPGEGFDVEQLLTPAEARAAYFAAVTIAPPGVEHVGLADATGRILAAAAISDADYPADSRSTMDGFALVAAGGRSARRITGEIRMGHAPPGPIAAGEAMRIPTGGVLPSVPASPGPSPSPSPAPPPADGIHRWMVPLGTTT